MSVLITGLPLTWPMPASAPGLCCWPLILFLTAGSRQRTALWLSSSFFMFPELFRIGNFPINTYGVFLALAFLGAIMITVRLGTQSGLPKERIYDLCLWMLLSS